MGLWISSTHKGVQTVFIIKLMFVCKLCVNRMSSMYGPTYCLTWYVSYEKANRHKVVCQQSALICDMLQSLVAHPLFCSRSMQIVMEFTHFHARWDFTVESSCTTYSKKHFHKQNTWAQAQHHRGDSDPQVLPRHARWAWLACYVSESQSQTMNQPTLGKGVRIIGLFCPVPISTHFQIDITCTMIETSKCTVAGVVNDLQVRHACGNSSCATPGTVTRNTCMLQILTALRL